MKVSLPDGAVWRVTRRWVPWHRRLKGSLDSVPGRPFAILGRVLVGRHWTVELRRGWRPYAEERAGDWQASGLRIHGLADDLRQGTLPR